MSRCGMLCKDVRRSVNSSLVQIGARASAVRDPPELEPIKVGDLGRVEDDGGGTPGRAYEEN